MLREHFLDYTGLRQALRLPRRGLCRRAASAQRPGPLPRHLTRVFREATGVTVQDYATRLRLERARSLLQDPHLTIEAVATRCGFETARQLRRLWKEVLGTTPSAARG